MADTQNSFTQVPEFITSSSEAAVGRVSAPRTNPALQLAESLRNLNPALTNLGIAYTKQLKEEAQTAAKAAAIKTSGKEYAQAVRDGSLSETQNPFFIEDYNKESAYLRAQTDIAQLRDDSQTWPEQNDPQAYQARYLKHLSEIQSKYGSDPDSQEGFLAAANPAMQQDFAANTAQRAQQISQERQANMATLVAQQIGAVQGAKGGRATPEETWAALSGLKDQYLSTGGTPEQWDKLVYNGVVAAALLQKKPGLLDLLKDSKSGSAGAIYSLPGMAPDIEATRYRIRADIENAEDREYSQLLHNDAIARRNAQSQLYERFGSDYLTGKVPANEILDAINSLDVPASVKADVLGDARRVGTDYAGIAEAHYAQFAQSAQGRAELLDLYQRGRAMGWSPELEAEWGSLYLRGDVSEATMKAALDESVDTVKAAHNGRIPREVAKQMDNYVATGKTVYGASTILIAQTNKALRQQKARPFTQAEIDHVMTLTRQTADYYLKVHPGDYTGAVEEAKKAAADLMRPIYEQRLQRNTNKKKGSSK